ncbi:Spy/CpxP family protein refolding chaperone [Noviherbaspirillum massiliense]|uniref:Spy/CpxP family protein refolding chaperone n=1 Tax=Noviherbaspirillum massiliense TaxID=1465823 RepID=UPI0002E2F296|nr:Spy/CpxP family protein refolding chaperone [Noviherbaspirillum massiliense]
MANFRKSLMIGVATIAFGAGSFAAYADQNADGQSGRGRVDSQQMQERMAKRQAELHDKLKLNATQEGAWKTFAEKMKPAERPARPSREEMAKLSVPERMDRMLALMKEREARMTERVAATKQFYATLTPEQQKIFNEQFRPGLGRDHGHGHRHAPR